MLNQSPQTFVDIRIILILCYAAVAVTIPRYFGHTQDLLPYLLDHPSRFTLWFCSTFFGSDLGRFHSMLYWAGVIIFFYLLIPVWIVKFIFRMKLSDFGFRFSGILNDYPVYLLMVTFMIPLVYFASATKSFQARYPLYQPQGGSLFPTFLWWELTYFIQFIAVEFFFRGFILHGIKNRFGIYSIFVMVLPYCFVHFGKPFGETISAIFAGIILGTLSLKSRSIIWGVAIHYSVAITMDLFALWREGIPIFHH